MRGCWAALGAALTVACGGSAVDLGHRDKTGFADLADLPSASTEAQPTPQTLYEGDALLNAFTVDETTLYALIDVPEDHGQLVSCPIERCRTERQELARGVGSYDSLAAPTPLLLVSGALFWMYGAMGPPEGVAMCPTSGCETPVLAPQPYFTSGIAADETHVYWVCDDGWLTRWGTDGSEPERLRNLDDSPGVDGATAGSVSRLSVAGDYVYLQLSYTPAVFRVRKDGAAEPELLFMADHISSLGATPSDLYYTSQTLAGSLRAYSTSGEGDEQILASNQRWPMSLLVADSEAFWVNQEQPGFRDAHGTLLSCLLPGCESVRTKAEQLPIVDAALGGLEMSQRLALNSHSLFWAERAQSLHSALRRLPR